MPDQTMSKKDMKRNYPHTPSTIRLGNLTEIFTPKGSDNEFMNNTDNDLITMVNAGEPISTYLQLAKKTVIITTKPLTLVKKNNI